MAMSKAEFLPEELIIDILYRLPVKSIGRCRCLSKHWRNFLSHPKFIKHHFNLHAHTQVQKLILVTWRSQLHTITFDHHMLQMGEIYGVPSKVDFQQLTHNWMSVAGSCNGLVLVIDRAYETFLINPTTLKYYKIPISPLHFSFYMYGLGYDVVSDDYKVVALSYPVKNNEFKTVTCVSIYSMRKGLWKKLEDSPYNHSLSDPASGVLVNGALHWLACRCAENANVIAAFDLSVDKFYEVQRPTDLRNHYFNCNLAALKGCLCISTNRCLDKDTITFWVMKEYGVEESWTKFKIREPSLDVSHTTLLCSIGDDDVLLDVDKELLVYNITENRHRDLLIDVNPIIYEARTFVDSLVSPYFGSETEGSCIM